MSEHITRQGLCSTGMGPAQKDLEEQKQALFQSHDFLGEVHWSSPLFLKLLAEFITAPGREIGVVIEKGLKLIAESIQVDRITLTELSNDWSELDITHCYRAPEVGPVPAAFSKSIPWLIGRIRGRETTVLVKLPDDLPDEAIEDRLYFQEEGIKSALALPLKVGESIVGALFVASLRSERQWPDELVKEVERVGEIFANAIDRKKSMERIDELFRFEQLLSEISATYINLPSGGVDSAIVGGLERIGRFLRADRCVLYRFLNSEGTFQPVSFWRNDRVEKLSAHGISNEEYQNFFEVWAKHGMERVPKEIMSSDDSRYLFDKWVRGESLQITRPDDLPEDASKWKDVLLRLNAKSHLSVPFSVGGSIVGAIALVSVYEYRVWPQEIIQRLRIFGEILFNARMRKQTDIELQNAFLEIKGLKDQIEADYSYLRDEIKSEYNFEEIIGQSDSLKRVFLEIEQVAPIDTTVLILGETGTGKELVARAIHNASQRRGRPLIKVSCATLPSNLAESELFGYEKGAFTGATAKRVGRFELADGATIFLDEIGELPLDLQPKLLRALQDGEFERLGGEGRTIRSDVRVIAATNRDLREEVEKGRFRRDLWYRLNVFPITLPPLRNRKEDIPLLVNWFVNKYSKKLGKTITKIPVDVMKLLKGYYWPGNVRELENVIERSVIITRGSTFMLTENIERTQADTGRRTLAEMEHEYILRVLEECDWRIEGQNGAAKTLGLNPGTLRFRMKKLGIKRPEQHR
jgi:formate hydrogenlyase transcriptional activator